MKILVACEFSQRVTTELLKLGHDAYSCDLELCEGEYPVRHIQDDCRKIMYDNSWDLIIAHPPCTHLAVSGNAHAAEKIRDGRRQEAMDFFMGFVKLRCKWAIENPIGIMSTVYRKPDQVVSPHWFGDKERKATCLWLNGLPLLYPVKMVSPEVVSYQDKNGHTRTCSNWHWKTGGGKGKMRSITYPGMARAMAYQWTKGTLF